MSHKKWAKPTLKCFAISLMFSVFFCLFGAHAALMAPMVQAQNFFDAGIENVLERSKVLRSGNVFVAAGNVDKQQAHLIFYKAKSPHFKGAITVYVNGMYHTSLASNAFSALCVSPGVVNLTIKPVMVGMHDMDEEGHFRVIEFQGGRHHYVRVSEGQGVQVLQMVSEQVALTELVTAREQIHTHSRVTPVQVCRSAPARSVTQSAP